MSWPSTSKQSRGYGGTWLKRRARVLKRDNYLCQCRHCKAASRVLIATEVDHVIPKTQGGTDDDANLQSINGECHKVKNIEDQGVRPREKVRIGRDGLPIW